jgi:hypothetical protein
MAGRRGVRPFSVVLRILVRNRSSFLVSWLESSRLLCFAAVCVSRTYLAREPALCGLPVSGSFAARSESRNIRAEPTLQDFL